MAFSLVGCSPAYFLYQAGKGQLRLLNRGKPLEQVISDPRTSRDLSALLSRVPEIRAFGERAGLKPTSNYREYVALDQDSVVYVVTVSEALALRPRIFRFPVVGSFNYLGWFSRDDAREFADGFERDGYDVDLRGASAFSTLGWFRDPLLSSMIPMKEGRVRETALPELVNVFLHESVHATVYVPDQTSFNESLASFVADGLTREFFESLPEPERKGYTEWTGQRKHGEEVRSRMAGAYRDLAGIYDSGLPDAEKRMKKEAYLSALQAELRFSRRITNATLIQFRTYHPEDRGFRALLQSCGGSYPCFLGKLSRLRAKDFPKPQAEDWKPLLSMLAGLNE